MIQKTAATAARVELLQQTTGSIVDTLVWILTCALEEGVVGALVQYLAQTGAFFMAEVKIINHTNHDELKNYDFYTNQSSVTVYCYISYQDCKPRTRSESCYKIRDRETCLITSDPRTKWYGPCDWCGEHCGNDNVCEPHVYIQKYKVTDYETCLK